MTGTSLLAYTAVAALLTVTPGADTMLVVRNVMARGRRAGVVTTLGICSGLFVHATFSALGLSLVLARSAAAFGIAKLVGAGYLTWLGVQSLRRAARSNAAHPVAAGTPGARSPDAGRSWREGFLTNVLNPKVAVFYLAFLPQFVGPGDRLLPTFLLLAAIHAALGIVWLSLIASLLEGVRGWLARPAARRAFEGVSGAVLVGFGARLALARR
jgi:RhtB (resistance to homoserine/threonine) family protein